MNASVRNKHASVIELATSLPWWSLEQLFAGGHSQGHTKWPQPGYLRVLCCTVNRGNFERLFSGGALRPVETRFYLPSWAALLNLRGKILSLPAARCRHWNGVQSPRRSKWPRFTVPILFCWICYRSISQHIIERHMSPFQSYHRRHMSPFQSVTMLVITHVHTFRSLRAPCCDKAQNKRSFIELVSFAAR